MASSNQPSHGPRSSTSHLPPSSTAFLLEKSRLHARRSTPDSEALASSDDDQDPRSHQASRPYNAESNLHAAKIHRPARRASWLNELPAPNRKSSFTGASTFSPNNSQPATPAGESGTKSGNMSSGSNQPTSLGRSSQMPSSLNWSSGIWSTESRKDPPARLAEVIPSPTSMVPPTSFGDIEPNSSSYRESSGESNIPFAIPLHPTPKTYRSQSYSVGQFEPESAGGLTSTPAANPYFMNSTARVRSNQPSGLQHRPSRPSMLSEMSNEGHGLGQVQEVEDDDESTNGSSQQGVQISSAEERTIQYLTRENALLRQQAAAAESREHRLRSRPSISTQGSNPALRGAADSRSVQGALAEEGSDYAVDEANDIQEMHGFRRQQLALRRFSEAQVDHHSQSSSMGLPINNKLENLKKGHWQSSLGFGGLEDIPQSRRHSFADPPTGRHPSTSSSTSIRGLGAGIGLGTNVNAIQDKGHAYGEGSPSHVQGENRESLSFHSRFEAISRPKLQTSYSQNLKHAEEYFSEQGHYKRLMRERSSNSALSPTGTYYHHQPRANQVLYIVVFKCSRADVFYISEGTGLEVKPGDLVVVEADRGTDLGTVIRADVSWDEAKRIKEAHVEDHYRWLMMFSERHRRPGAASGIIQGPAPSGSAIGGMGPQTGHGSNQDSNASEIKPKMIKRLAQAHEIQALKDKEGNEAKAKRVCQQKVSEHRLNMEILDAEFQMDWKKLTFFYYAEAYINFNTLVTDLFKVYKTRIWMSAVNPASFANPSQTLLPPSGIGPGAIGVGHDYGFNGNATQTDTRSNNASFQSSPIQQNNFSYGFQPFGQLTRQPAFPMTEFQVPQTPNGSAQFAMPQFTAGTSAQAFAPSFTSPSMANTAPARPQNYHPANETYIESLQALTLRNNR